MSDSELILEAIQFAAAAHRGQKYGVGDAAVDYIVHPIMVANLVDKEDEKIVAILHDVLEDTDAKYADIYKKFGNEIAEAVQRLSRYKYTDYKDYIVDVSHTELTTKVKIADLTVNLWFSENGFFARKDRYQVLIPRYKWALNFLQKVVVVNENKKESAFLKEGTNDR